MGIHKETPGFGLAPGGLSGRRSFTTRSLAARFSAPPTSCWSRRASGADPSGDYEPANRLLMDPVLQFQPWLEFNRAMLRQGRLPLWNPHAGCGAPHLANGQSAVFDPFHLLAYLGTVPRALAWMAAGRLWVAGLGMFLLARAWGAGAWGRWFAGLVYPFCGFLIVWLLYPVTPVAIWLPWLLLATDRVAAAARTRGRPACWPSWSDWSSSAGTSRPARICSWPPDSSLSGDLAAFLSWRERSRRIAGLGQRDRPGVAPGGRADRAAGLLPGAEPGLGRSPARDPALVDNRKSPSARRGMHGLALRVRQPAARSSQPGQGARRAQPQ